MWFSTVLAEKQQADPWEDIQILVTASLEAESSMILGGTLHIYIKLHLALLENLF